MCAETYILYAFLLCIVMNVVNSPACYTYCQYVWAYIVYIVCEKPGCAAFLKEQSRLTDFCGSRGADSFPWSWFERVTYLKQKIDNTLSSVVKDKRLIGFNRSHLITDVKRRRCISIMYTCHRPPAACQHHSIPHRVDMNAGIIYIWAVMTDILIWKLTGIDSLL